MGATLRIRFITSQVLRGDPALQFRRLRARPTTCKHSLIWKTFLRDLCFNIRRGGPDVALLRVVGAVLHVLRCWLLRLQQHTLLSFRSSTSSFIARSAAAAETPVTWLCVTSRSFIVRAKTLVVAEYVSNARVCVVASSWRFCAWQQFKPIRSFVNTWKMQVQLSLNAAHIKRTCYWQVANTNVRSE